MTKNILHITNGNSLTTILIDSGIKDDILTWQEMLCEGPTTELIDDDEFFKVRKQFLLDYYDIEVNEAEFREELGILNATEKFSEIVLWFEYDLFCHINMMAVISLIRQKNIILPIYLVCSGRVEGEADLKGLSELSQKQLMKHYEQKIKLTTKDIDLMSSLWKTYCGKDHNLFKPIIVQQSSFDYLSNCLKAHLKRFPDSKTGLNILEKNTLELLKTHTIKTKRHLLGYALNYQGYYGYSDLQIMRMIDKLAIFFEAQNDQIKLNRKGHEALLGQHNFSEELNNGIVYGGVNKLDFRFSTTQNKLVKTA